jgi:hypothetical protein
MNKRDFMNCGASGVSIFETIFETILKKFLSTSPLCLKGAGRGSTRLVSG